MTKANPLENDVKKEIKKLLDEFGWHHWPGSASSFSVGGVSDRLAVRGFPRLGSRPARCVFLAIEAKLDKADGSPRQEEFLADVRRQGGIGVVVNRDRLGKFRQLLEAIERDLFPPAAEDPVMVPGVPSSRFGNFGWTGTLPALGGEVDTAAAVEASPDPAPSIASRPWPPKRKRAASPGSRKTAPSPSGRDGGPH